MPQGGSRTKHISTWATPEERDRFKEVCEHVGVPMSTALRMFMLQVNRDGKLPLDVGK